jgi:hypothetical protein
LVDKRTDRHTMKSRLVIQVNQKMVLEYDRNIRLLGKQREFLDKMDIDMVHGIALDGQQCIDPDRSQRRGYVAMRVIQAIQNSDNGMINAMCAYLVTRFPNLHTIGFEDYGEELIVNFTFDNT